MSLLICVSNSLSNFDMPSEGILGRISLVIELQAEQHIIIKTDKISGKIFFIVYSFDNLFTSL